MTAIGFGMLTPNVVTTAMLPAGYAEPGALVWSFDNPIFARGDGGTPTVGSPGDVNRLAGWNTAGQVPLTATAVRLIAAYPSRFLITGPASLAPACWSFSRAVSADGVNLIRSPILVCAAGGWDRALVAAGWHVGDPVLPSVLAAAYASVEPAATLPNPVTPAAGSAVVTFTADTGTVDIVADGGRTVLRHLPLTARGGS